MKYYQINIQFKNSNPFIWRRVIMPAGATFKRLHDVIQSVTNFKDYHLYEFQIDQEGLAISNDPEYYGDYEVKTPRVKIDKYLERYKELDYMYDFGDGWEIVVKLEVIYQDYPIDHPVLIDGANDAPPEDVGGMPGYYDFKKKYKEDEEITEWAEMQGFSEYDPIEINQRLKHIKYVKKK
jgi:hypothetical protein